MFCYWFKIAGIIIALKTESQITVSERFRPFQCEKVKSYDYEVTFHQVDQLPVVTEPECYNELAFGVGQDAGGCYFRRFRNVNQDGQVYAVAYYEWEKRSIEVRYLSCGSENLNQSDNCFFHIAWETILQLEKCMILHACAVDTPYGGILFSGRSGIGKSTQGDLWCRYENAFIINGDRPILKKENGIWYAYGAPYAGSSRCHKNVNVPIRAIVMLKRGENSIVHKLNPAEAFRKVYAGMTISTWNPECVEISCDLALSLTSEISVYEMQCTPDQQAVERLKQSLLMEADI